MLTELFDALRDPTRRGILKLLQRGDMAAGDIGKHLVIAPSTLSAHLRVLKQAGLILPERHRTSIVYSLNVAAYEDALARILEFFSVDSSNQEDYE